MTREGYKVNCLVCSTEFHESDIAIMEEGEEPICDNCALEAYEKNRTENN